MGMDKNLNYLGSHTGYASIAHDGGRNGGNICIENNGQEFWISGMARNRRSSPEINAGAMADIAFLLLIFFLVTTTMDVDTGIARKLPPMPEDEQIEDDSQIHARNIYVVLVNSNNQLLVEGLPMDISQLKDGAKDFINNNSKIALNQPNILSIYTIIIFVKTATPIYQVHAIP